MTTAKAYWRHWYRWERCVQRAIMEQQSFTDWAVYGFGIFNVTTAMARAQELMKGIKPMVTK